MAPFDFYWIQAISFFALMLDSCGDPIHIDTGELINYIFLDDEGIKFDPAYPNISFSVRATNDAHLALSKSKPISGDDMYEVVIGGWKNTKSAIRTCEECTPDNEHMEIVLNDTEFMSFWVAWSANSSGTYISVGKGVVPLKDTFLHLTHGDGHVINYVAITTGWKSAGTWVFGHVDGGWSDWGDWSGCSTTCGTGIKLRHRSCDNPVPEYGGAECPESFEDETTCSIADCPIDGNWGTWGSWSACSFTCGGGNQERSRTCSDPAPQFGGRECDGEEGRLDEKTCNLDKCPVHGSWSSWEDWTSCSESCGLGVFTRARRCDNPTPSYGGESCEGLPMENDTCIDIPCPVNGNWSSWSEWSECSASCNYGNRTHIRSCDSPAPVYGGLPCEGNEEEPENCFIEPCPVDGDWSEWSNWTACSETCGSATKVHFRTCDDPSPAYGGNNCSGSDNETVDCEWIPCEVNGSWASWTPWSACSVSCGLGIASRTRNCSDPPPLYGGLPCSGDPIDNNTCNDIRACPIDGFWSPWGYWGECTATCGSGLKTRSRTCTNPQPLHGGKECAGDGKNNFTCNFLDCREILKTDEEEETTEADGAVTIGIIGVVLCASILGAVVVLDIATIHRHLSFMKRNIDDFLYRRGWKKIKPGSHRSRRKSSRKRRGDSPADRYAPEPVDTSQVEIRLDNDGRTRATMPPNNALTAQLDVNGLRGQGPSRFVGRNNIAENNLNSLDLKNFDSRYHKALNKYSNLEFSQTQL